MRRVVFCFSLAFSIPTREKERERETERELGSYSLLLDLMLMFLIRAGLDCVRHGSLSLSLSLSLFVVGVSRGGSRFFPASQQRLVFWPTRRMQCRSKRNELSLSLCLETHQKSRYSLDLGLIIAERDRERRPNRRDDDDVKQRLTWQPSPPPACVE